MKSLKVLRRYMISFIAYIKIFIFNRIKKGDINKLFDMTFDEVHVVCPGPSAVKLLEHNISDNAAVIFVNHAVKISLNVKGAKQLFYFSADGVRTLEAIKLSRKEIENCTSILAPWHLFHINNAAYFNALDLILLPKTHFNWKYGLETCDMGPESFSALEKRPNGSGFGSLVYTLKLATLFSPKKITLWGCDFGNKDGEKYFDKSTPIRNDTPFDLIKSHVNLVSNKISEMGISINEGGG